MTVRRPTIGPASETPQDAVDGGIAGRSPVRTAGRAIALAAGLAAGLLAFACNSDPTTVLASDLPQVPNMTARESTGIRQADGAIEAGVFAYKGEVDNLGQRIKDTVSRFSGLGWTLVSERTTAATARLEFGKGQRRAVVEIIRNDLEPAMSTAVTTVRTEGEKPPAPAAPAANGGGAGPSGSSGRATTVAPTGG